MNRRHFLGMSAAAATLAGLGIPLPVRAANPSDLKFVFVFASGGWDPTRVFATEFDNPAVHMEPAAERATAGNVAYVDHPGRPAVRTFMEAHHDRMVVMNGVMVRSIAHEICTMIAMTGTTAGTSPDWPAALAGQQLDRYTLPHLVLDGPSFPGDLGVAVARSGAGGQLDALLSGDAVFYGSEPGEMARVSRPSEDLIDRYLERRSAARVDASKTAIDAQLASDFHRSLQRSRDLKQLRYAIDFSGGGQAQTRVAVDALSLGLCRCVTLGTAAFNWDSHANNDEQQSPLWEGLFTDLAQLMTMLENTPGESTGSLAEETVVVVMSEMGRTPALNGTLGKDHWPYTSTMLLGANLVGDRVIGGFDGGYYGLNIDPGTADLDDDGQVLSAEAVGATLLAMADIDPEPFVSGVAPITGVFS